MYVEGQKSFARSKIHRRAPLGEGFGSRVPYMLTHCKTTKISNKYK
jgi:hypothetical protein